MEPWKRQQTDGVPSIISGSIEGLHALAGWYMRLEAVGIQRYRSIKRTPRLDLHDLTILVGPNNEGKSNILRAIAVAMRQLRPFGLRRDRPVTKLRLSPVSGYVWENDFPKDLQERMPQGSTIVDLWFQLTEQERQDFREATGVNLKTELPIRLAMGNRQVTFSVRKQGPGRKTLMNRAGIVAMFVGRNITVEHVNAIRQATDSVKVVRDMLDEELSLLLDQPQYTAALNTLTSALVPTLDRLSVELQGTLTDFLPDVRHVTIDLPTDQLVDALLNRVRILVDDGVETDLATKGDGVQSLAALALVRRAYRGIRRTLVLAVEEPESHLHPRAVHLLKSVLEDIAATQQVILTTHSPLLVDRYTPANNIVVRGNKASPARDLNDLRDSLGIRLSDNLASTNLVLIVEGECDKQILTSFFAVHYNDIAKAMRAGDIAIESIRGATNLLPRIQTLRQQLCKYYVFLDNDDAGRAAIKAARRDSLLLETEHRLATVPHLRDSEIEDFVDPAIYSRIFLDQLGVDLTGKAYTKSKKKWSQRVVDTARLQGKIPDDQFIAKAKQIVAAAVKTNPGKAIIPQTRACIELMAGDLERMLGE